MAWEWVAPVATGIVGAAGVTANVLIAGITTRTTRDVAKYSARAQLEVSRDERRAETLRESAEYTNGVGHLLDKVARRIATTEEVDESTKRYSHILAGVAIHFDDRTRNSFIAWNESVQGLMRLAEERGQCQELEQGMATMNVKQGEFLAAANHAANRTPPGLG